MSDIKYWSTDAASNTAAPPNGAPEGWNARDANDTIRELMAAVKRQYLQAQWVDLGDVPTYQSSAIFRLSGDKTADYHQYRRVRAACGSGNVYGYISAASYIAPYTTVALALDSGQLDGSMSSVALGILTANNHAVPANLTGGGGGGGVSLSNDITLSSVTATRGNFGTITASGGVITSVVLQGPSVVGGTFSSVTMFSPSINGGTISGATLVNVSGIGGGSGVSAGGVYTVSTLAVMADLYVDTQRMNRRVQAADNNSVDITVTSIASYTQLALKRVRANDATEYDTATGEFTSGFGSWRRVSVQIKFKSDNVIVGEEYTVVLRKNGSNTYEGQSRAVQTGSSHMVNLTVPEYLGQGDKLSIGVAGSGSGQRIIDGSPLHTFWTIETI